MRLTLALVLFGILGHSGRAQQRLEFTIDGAAGSMVYLANYDGNRLYYADSAKADAKGLAVFSPRSPYPAGMYALLIGGKRLEVIVTEPLVRMSLKAVDPMGSLVIAASDENRVYHKERVAIEAGPAASRDAALRALSHDYPGTLAAAIIQLSIEPEGSPGPAADSAATADWKRLHYWDNTDLGDARMTRVPQFQNRLEALAATAFPKDPIATTEYIDGLIARASGEVRAFLVSWAINWYANGVSQESASIFVRLAEKHVCTGPNGTRAQQWLPKDKWDATCAKAAAKSHIVIGNTTRDLKLCDTTGTHWTSLHSMPQSCIVVVFWSPHCGHCKQAMPLMHERYTEEWKKLDVGVYAVGDARDNSLYADWKSFIREHDLDWVNVAIPSPIYQQWKANPSAVVPKLTDDASMRYTETWDANNTPAFYVLDKERRVLARPSSIAGVMQAIQAYRGRH